MNACGQDAQLHEEPLLSAPLPLLHVPHSLQGGRKLDVIGPKPHTFPLFIISAYNSHPQGAAVMLLSLSVLPQNWQSEYQKPGKKSRQKQCSTV